MALRSSNPVFTRSETFSGRNANGNPTYPGNGQTYAGYGSPAEWSVGSPGAPGTPITHSGRVDEGPMTIDSVVQKTGLTLGIVVVFAAATWLLTGDIDNQSTLNTLYALSMVGALGGFALSMVNSFKKVISPALVLAYAALEGLFVGAFSKVLENVFAGPDGSQGGLVIGAVLGTLAAVGGTLAAYKFFNIRVGQRFRTWVIAAMFGFVALSFLDLILGFFNADFGFNSFGAMGLLSSVIGLGLGVLMLILDFDFVERGIAAGLPERESWRAAFGLTVTIVWIYIELLRLLAILRN
jgi:uncharacterized YccA/Bax inhibitor family protein